MTTIIFIFCSQDGRLRTAWRFLIAAVFFVIAEYACAYSVLFITGRPPGNFLFEALHRPLLLGVLLAGFGLMARVLDRKPGNSLANQGLGFSGRWINDLFYGAALGLGMISAAVLAIKFIGSYSVHVSTQPASQSLVVLWILLTSAMAEEVAFRGYPFQTLVRGIGPWYAVATMSALFGALHFNNPHVSVWGLLNTVLVGVLLSVAYLRTNALWFPIAIHFTWNTALGLVFGLPVSGLQIFSVAVHGSAAGPKWLTGGDYGIEASLTGAVVISLGILVVLLAMPQRPSESLALPAANSIQISEQPEV